MPNNCLSSIQPDKQIAHDEATFNIYFHFRTDLHDVVLLGADLQEKDLKEELDLGLDPLGELLAPPLPDTQKNESFKGSNRGQS